MTLASPSLHLFRRELRSLFRDRRIFWFLVGIVGLASLLPLSLWPEETGAVTPGRNVAALSSALATQLAGAIIALAPILAGSIAGEREQGTFDLLFTTRLAPVSIVLTKALVPVAYICVVLASAAPPVCALYLLGGTRLGDVGQAYVIVLLSLVMSTLVCALHSLRSANTAQATLRGLLWAAIWNCGSLLVPYALVRLVLRTVPGTVRWVDRINLSQRASAVAVLLVTLLLPFLLLAMLMVGPFLLVVLAGATWALSPFTVAHQALLAGTESSYATGFFCGYATVVSLTHFVLLVESAGRTDVGFAGLSLPHDASTRHEDPMEARLGSPRSLFTLWLLGLAYNGSPLLSSPVLMRELRTQFHAARLYRLGLLGLGFLSTLWGLRAGITGMVIPGILLAAISVPAVGATAFTREKEQGNLDFLRGTLMTSFEVVWGKLLAILSSTSGILAAPLWMYTLLFVFFYPVAYGSGWSPRNAVSAMGVLLTTIFLLSSGSLLISTLARGSTSALLIAYGASFAAYLSWPLLEALMSQRPGGMVESLHPIALLQTVERSRRGEFPLASLFNFLGMHFLLAAAAFCGSWWQVSRRRMREG